MLRMQECLILPGYYGMRQQNSKSNELKNIKAGCYIGEVLLTPWRLGGFGDFRKKQQYSVALPTP